MSFRRYDPASRYRQRAQQRMIWGGVLSLVAGLAGIGGYGLGYQGAGIDNSTLTGQVEDLKAERDRLQQDLTRLMADSHSAAVRANELARQMQADMPQEGPLKEIMAHLKGHLESGVAPERLLQVIGSLSPPQNCSDPETRRFVVQTPVNKKAGGFVSIADGALVIRGEGVSVKSKGGAVEAWYDPSQPVHVSFEWTDSGLPKVIEKKAVLPVSQVIVVGGREYRITVDKGAKSFAKVMFDSCDSP